MNYNRNGNNIQKFYLLKNLFSDLNHKHLNFLISYFQLGG